MTEHERFLFDLQGYLTVPDALTAEQISSLNAVLDEHLAQETAPDAESHRFYPLLQWGGPIFDLIDNPRITPYLEEILGRQFRLDHEYADIIRTGRGPIGNTLHGGATPFDPSQYYHWKDGKMYNGLTVVAYNLKDVNPGDGGFAGVPGSHKANLPFPNDWRDLNNLHPCVKPITGPAGTAILFTEALTHGTLPWKGKDERRTIFFKYSPNPVSWASTYYDADRYPGLTERQRDILEAPNSRFAGRRKHTISGL